jgi:hypothetical protein
LIFDLWGSIPQPGENNGGGFAQARRDGDEARLAGERLRGMQGPASFQRWVSGQPSLVVVGRVAGGGGEELLEGHCVCRVLDSPIIFSKGVGHLLGYPIFFLREYEIR